MWMPLSLALTIRNQTRKIEMYASYAIDNDVTCFCRMWSSRWCQARWKSFALCRMKKTWKRRILWRIIRCNLPIWIPARGEVWACLYYQREWTNVLGSAQFKLFLELICYLMKQCDQDFVVDKYDDPNTSVNKLILSLKSMGFPLDYPASKLKLGYGEAACEAIDFLCDKVQRVDRTIEINVMDASVGSGSSKLYMDTTYLPKRGLCRWSRSGCRCWSRNRRWYQFRGWWRSVQQCGE